MKNKLIYVLVLTIICLLLSDATIAYAAAPCDYLEPCNKDKIQGGNLINFYWPMAWYNVFEDLIFPYASEIYVCYKPLGSDTSICEDHLIDYKVQQKITEEGTLDYLTLPCDDVVNHGCMLNVQSSFFRDVGETYWWDFFSYGFDSNTGKLYDIYPVPNCTCSFRNGPSLPPGAFKIGEGAVANGHVNVDGGDLTFKWTASSKAYMYYLQIVKTDTNCSTANFPSDAINNHYWAGGYNDNSVTLPPPADEGTYCWRIAAWNDYNLPDHAGGTYAYSDIRSFSVAVKPGPFDLQWPEQGSYASGKSVTFHWSSSANAENYTLWLATKLKPSGEFDFSIAQSHDAGNNLEFTLPFSYDGQEYYWLVEAINGEASTYSNLDDEKKEWRFVNDCSPEIGLGTGYAKDWPFLYHMDTCYETDTRMYLLKDISRRLYEDNAFNNPHASPNISFPHGGGKMLTNASIITKIYDPESGTFKTLADTDNNWVDEDQLLASDAHVHAEMVYDYLWQTFKHKSYDDQGNSMMTYIKDPGCKGPNWNKTDKRIAFCNSSKFTRSLDIVAHEWGHAITDSFSDLNNSRETGALNEAFSDWLGVSTKCHYNSADCNWTIGEDVAYIVAPGLPALRSLSDPPSIPSQSHDSHPIPPDTYKGDNWKIADESCTDLDNTDDCWVHVNCGVPDKMFYLLAHEGINIHPVTQIQVHGIGLEPAMKIALFANKQAWNIPNISFLKAADGMIAAAQSLFKKASNEDNQVRNAWAAVKVYDLPDIKVSNASLKDGSPVSGVTVTGGGKYEWGTVVTLTTPSAVEGFEFLKWVDEKGSKITQDKTLTCQPAPCLAFVVDDDHVKRDENAETWSKTVVAVFNPLEPVIKITPTSCDFKSVYTFASAPCTLTVSNAGKASLNIGSIALEENDNFEIVADNCSNTTLDDNSDETCSLEISFKPQTAGAKKASLTIPSNDPKYANKSVVLKGTGKDLTITIASVSNGKITLSAGDKITYGGSATYVVTPDDGYEISDVKVDGKSVGPIPEEKKEKFEYKFENIITIHKMSATFKIKTFTITATAGEGGTITPASATVNYKKDKAFNIKANTGYEITDVSVDKTSKGVISKYTFDKVTADHTITATFAQKKQAVNVLFKDNDPSGGVITSDSGHPGISCGSECSHDYGYGDSITLSASPNAGYIFKGWSGGGCSGKGDCKINKITADKTVTADFDKKSITVKATTSGHGSISPKSAVVSYGNGDNDGKEFTITADTNYKIDDVTVNGTSFGVGDGKTLSFTYKYGDNSLDITKPVTIKATFSEIKYTLTVTNNKTSGGNIKGNGINCGTACSAEIKSGAAVKLTADPETDNEFGGWPTDICTTVSANKKTCTFTMDAARNVTVDFPIKTYTLTINSSDGSVSCDGGACNGSYAAGSQIVLKASAGEGHAFKNWSGDCKGKTDTCTLTMKKDKNVTANFTDIKCAVKVTKTGKGSYAADDKGALDYKEIRTYTFTPNTNYSIDDVKLDGNSVKDQLDDNNTYKFTCLKDDHKIEVAFKEKSKYSLDVSKSGSGGGKITSVPAGINCGGDCSQKYYEGTTITLTAKPDKKSSFDGWSGCIVNSDNTCTVTITTAGAGGNAVAAAFTKK